MAQYQKIHYYASDSKSTHHHYYAGHDDPRDPSPDPPSLPLADPADHPHRPWNRERRASYQAHHRPSVEIREPSAHAHYGTHIPVPRPPHQYPVNHESFPPRFFHERRGRARASPDADEAHKEMVRNYQRQRMYDVNHAYDAGFDRAFESGIRYGGRRPGYDTGSDGQGWQMSGIRRTAECAVMLKKAKKEMKKEKEGEYIRLRGEEKAWVKKREVKVKTVSRGKGRVRGGVNDVESMRVSIGVDERGVMKYERRVRLL